MCPLLVVTGGSRGIGAATALLAAEHWLLSDEASYITGAILDVSGGR
jgi:NAD(P)-dependent dehydrogenase (short-subunit alcohol dehydrogenase family)